MQAESQPTKSIPRMHRLTVAEVMEALKDAPPDAEIQFDNGGYLEAGMWRPWAEVEIRADQRTRLGPPINVVKTCWE